MVQFFNITTGFDWFIVILAISSLIIVLGQLLIGIFLGADTDLDLDGDGSADFDFGAIISPMAIIRFLLGSSGYLACLGILGRNREWWDYLIAVGVGLAVATLLMLLYWGMSKLKCEHVRESGESLVNRPGKIYSEVGNGEYIITIVINETSSELHVVSKSKRKYDVGKTVIVNSCVNGVYYID